MKNLIEPEEALSRIRSFSKMERNPSDEGLSKVPAVTLGFWIIKIAATIGLDIAKNVFQVHAIDAAEKVVIRKQPRRSQVPAFFERALLHSTSRWVFRCPNCARYTNRGT